MEKSMESFQGQLFAEKVIERKDLWRILLGGEISDEKSSRKTSRENLSKLGIGENTH